MRIGIVIGGELCRPDVDVHVAASVIPEGEWMETSKEMNFQDSRDSSFPNSPETIHRYPCSRGRLIKLSDFMLEETKLHC